MATTIPEAITTIPAGTLRLLLALIGYRAKARNRYGASRQWFRRRPARPCRRADPVQVEALTPSAGAPGAELASDPQTAGADRRTLIYLIIIGGCAELYNVRRGGGIWYTLEVLRRCDTFQRGTGGVISACSGLVSWAVNRSNRRKSHCKALCAVLRRGRYSCMYNTKRAVNACMVLYCSRAK